MCHDYAPGGRAYAFETTVAKERAQNVHIHAGVTEDADTPRLFLPSLQLNMRAGELPPPESNGRRYFNSMIPGDPLAIIWVRSTGKRSRARSPSWYDRFRLDVAAGSGQ